MSGIHHQCLLVGHLAQILHSESVLCPVLEYCAIAAISNEFVRVLCHCGVEVVLNHQHNSCCLAGTMGILVDRTSIHVVARAEAIHIDSAVVLQFFSKLRRKLCMKFCREIPQRIAKRQFFLIFGENLLAARRMVDVFIVRLNFGQHIGDACTNLSCKLLVIHNALFYFGLVI